MPPDISEHYVTARRTARFLTMGASEQPSELWFACHGYGQLASTFIRDLSPLDDGTRLIVAPEALSRFYVGSPHENVGASWMTREDRQNEIDDYLTYLDSVGASVFSRIDAAAIPVTVLGFSQGAATAARWACRSTFEIKRLILWGETLPPELEDEESVRRLRSMKLSVAGGTRERFFPESRRAELRERLDRLGIPFQEWSFEGGHRVDVHEPVHLRKPLRSNRHRHIYAPDRQRHRHRALLRRRRSVEAAFLRHGRRRLAFHDIELRRRSGWARGKRDHHT